MAIFKHINDSIFVQCFPGFESVNRYWDKERQRVVAKILPGEFYVSNQHEVISTTLGSCVSACIWDEVNKIGGMNHFMLPLTQKEAQHISWGSTASATRYGNYAMEHMINEMLKHGANRKLLKAKVFGGGNIVSNMGNIGQNNVEFVIEYLTTENIPIIASDLGLEFPRKIIFDPLNGKAFVKRLASLHNHTIENREDSYRHKLQKDPVAGDVELF